MGDKCIQASLDNAKLVSKEFTVVYTATISIKLSQDPYPHQPGFFIFTVIILCLFSSTYMYVFLNVYVHPHQIFR